MADRGNKDSTPPPLLLMPAGGGLTLNPPDNQNFLMPVVQSEPSLLDSGSLIYVFSTRSTILYTICLLVSNEQYNNLVHNCKPFQQSSEGSICFETDVIVEMEML